MKNNYIIQCKNQIKFLASLRGFIHCRGKWLKQLRRHLRMYMDRNAFYNVQNSANGVVFPVLMKASLPSGRGYKRVWWANYYRNDRPGGAFTGHCTKKTCPNTSIYPSSSPDCKQGVLCTGCQDRVLGGVAGVVCLCLVPLAKAWWVPLAHQSLNLSTHLRRYSHQTSIIWVVSRIWEFLPRFFFMA